jgi:regulator of sigma E protease
MLEWLAMLGHVLLAILALGILIIIHEGGHFLVARLSGMRVDRFSIGFGPKLWSFKRGETIYQIAAIPLGGFVQIAGLNPGEEGMTADDPRAYPNRPVWQRLATIFAGPATNYLFAILVTVALYLVWGVRTAAPVVDSFVEHSPAAAVGMQKGDEIVKVGTSNTLELDDVAPAVGASQGKPITVEVLRDGKRLSFVVTPQNDGGTYRMGVKMGPKETWAPAPTGERIKRALVYPFAYSAFILHSLAQTGVRGIVRDGSGPVGIVKVMREEIQHGPRYALWIVAAISIYLGLFNLLPLPGLDGGRLAFLVWEGISRRRVDQRIEQTVHMVGVLMLLALIVVITVKNDVNIPFARWFHR